MLKTNFYSHQTRKGETYFFLNNYVSWKILNKNLNCHRQVWLFSYMDSYIYSVSVCWLNLWAILVQIILANRCERKRLYSTKRTRYLILILRKTSEQFINMKDRIWICYCWTCSNVPCSGYTNCLELVELHLQNIFCVMPGGRIVYPKLLKIYLNTMIWLVSFVYIFKNKKDN